MWLYRRRREAVDRSMFLAAATSLRICGPLEVEIRTDDPVLRAISLERLNLFDARWEGPFRRVRITLERGRTTAAVAGTFLLSGRMKVDASEHEVVAVTAGGVLVRATLHPHSEDWEIAVPAEDITVMPLALDLEHALELALTTGWRRAGWIAVHAGAVEKEGRCLLLCAPSGGGKSTFAAVLLREGWRTLGDDKLLLRLRNGLPELAALIHTLNLDPAKRYRGVTQLALDALPTYSVASGKRRVPVDLIAPGATTLSNARPTHIVQLARKAECGFAATPLPDRDAATTLLRQIVIPSDRIVAGSILQTVMQAASGLKPLRVTVGNDAYRSDAWARSFEDLL